MIENLSLKNFRGISEGKIQDLERINILVGRNNSGKSTILDALYFFRGMLAPRNDFGEFVLTNLLQRRVTRVKPTEIEFFYNYLGENQIQLIVDFKNGHNLRVSGTRKNNSNEMNFQMYTSNFENPLSNFVLTLVSDPSLEVVASSVNRTHEPVNFMYQRFNRLSTTSGEPKAMADYFLEKGVRKDLEFISKITLVDADLVRKIEKIEDAHWAKILKTRVDKQLTRILNETYSLDIEGFSFANYLPKSSKIFALLPEISMHLDDYGDGFRYAFSILTLASQAKDTVLLLEEPSVHQHAGALKPLFQALTKIAMENNLQLIISVHNPTVIKIWTQISQHVAVFHLTKDKRGRLETRKLTGTDAKLLFDLGVDPSFLDIESYLVIEGCQDRVFFDNVAKKLEQKSLRELGYEPIECPKPSQKQLTTALASTGKHIVVCYDLDNKKAEEILKSHVNVLENKYGNIEVNDNILKISKTGSIIKLVPMGLPEDEDLRKVDITRFAMEDFLLKLIKIDDEVKKWVNIGLDELRKRALSLKPQEDLKKSKTLMMALGVIKDGMTIEELTEAIILKAKEDSVRAVVGTKLRDLFYNL